MHCPGALERLNKWRPSWLQPSQCSSRSSSSPLPPPCPPPRMVFQMPTEASAITQQSLTTVYVQSMQKALDLLISQVSLFQTDGEFILASPCSFPSSTLGLRLNKVGAHSPAFFFLSFQEGCKFPGKKHVFSKTEFTSEWDALKLGSP